MHLVLYGPPIPKMRHRNHGHIYYDPQAKEKAITKSLLSKHLIEAFSTQNKEKLKELSNLASGQSFSVTFVFRLPVANSSSDAQKNAKLWGLHECNAKPDLDNLEKFYCDCANQILFEDDRMVVEVKKKKVYSENPRTEIWIMHQPKQNLNQEEENSLLHFSPKKMENLKEDIDRLSSHFAFFDRDNSAHPASNIADHVQDLNWEDKQKWLSETGRLLASFASTWANELKKLESKNKKLKESHE